MSTHTSEVHLMDCMEYMKGLPDKCFDLAVVDPPYGINAGKMTLGTGKHAFKKGKDWDSEIPKQEYFDELFRVSENQIIWGGNYFPLPLNNNWIIWDKLNPNMSFSEAELAWCSINKNTRIFKRLSTLPDIDGIKRHPTQKSVKLYDWIFKNYAKDGDTIFDSHMGSQSSRIAADKAKLNFVGCELDPQYFKDGCKRFDLYKQQQTLF